MKVRKLYYEDCHLKTFTATVTGCTPCDRGWQITLDATAFYPEGGGQACDLGTLADARVLDVREREQNVIHLCDKPLAAGTAVEGVINWDRRLDQMQQHTGEHILSGLIHQRYGYQNVGFHVGKDVMEVDFDGPIPADALAELEAQANRVIWDNLQLRCRCPSPEELPAIPYRTKKALAWPVRIVEVPGIDICACCGVHTGSTGEVGMIKILSCVKFHQGVRLEMVCGKRAYEYMRLIYEQNRQVSQLLSAKMPETGTAAKRMAEQLAAEKLRCAALEKRVFDSIAAGYTGKGDVVHFEDGLSPASVRELADRIGAVCGGTAAVLSGQEGNYSLCMISRTNDLKELGAKAARALNGRGGGKPGSFQGSLNATRKQIEDFFTKTDS